MGIKLKVRAVLGTKKLEEVFDTGYVAGREWRRKINRLKELLPEARFGGYAWIVDLPVKQEALERIRRALEELYGLKGEELEQALEKIKKMNEAAWERYRVEPVIKQTEWLSMEEYMTLRRLAEQVSARKWRPRKETILLLLFEKGSPEEAAKAYIEKLSRIPGLIYSREAIEAEFKRYAKTRPTARFVPEKTRRGGTAYRVEGPVPREVMEELKEKLEVPYHYKTFNPLRRQEEMNTVYMRGAWISPAGQLYVAPWAAELVARMLEEKGYKVEAPWRREWEKTQAPRITRGVMEMLRPYQRRALEEWLKRGGRGTVVLPTGAGKTWIGLAAIEALKVPTCILVPTIELVRQWRQAIIEKLGVPPDQVGILGGGVNEIGKPILVAVYNSAVKHAQELARHYQLFIYDEAHHVAAKTFKEAAWETPAPYRLSLSATIERDDRNEELIFKLSGEPVATVSYEELVRQGYLAPVVAEVVEVPLPPELEQEKNKILEEINDLKRKMDDFNVTKISRLRNKLVARLIRMDADNPAKDKVAIELAGRHLKEGRKVFIYCRYVDQAKRIYEKLRQLFDGQIGLVTGSTNPRQRQEIFDAFREGRIRCLVTTKVLDEGINVPDAEVAIIVSSQSLRHPRQFIQRIGRVVRPRPDKISYAYVLLTSNGYSESRYIDIIRDMLREIYALDKLQELIEAYRKAYRRRAAEEARRQRAAARQAARQAGGQQRTEGAPVKTSRGTAPPPGMLKGKELYRSLARPRKSGRLTVETIKLAPYIGGDVYVYLYTPDGKPVWDGKVKVKKRTKRGREVGYISVNVPPEYAGKPLLVVILPPGGKTGLEVHA